jgi:hypothetical protein
MPPHEQRPAPASRLGKILGSGVDARKAWALVLSFAQEKLGGFEAVEHLANTVVFAA